LRRSPTPELRTLLVTHLSRNINKDHLNEIFGVYGVLKTVDIILDKRSKASRAAYLQYESRENAQKAFNHFDGVNISKIFLFAITMMIKVHHPSSATEQP
jgi:RNA-binding protein with serine-rich domain 1